MTAADDIALLAARAFPGAEQERVDGWLLRASPGERARRVNSALPVDGPADAGVVERWYRERGLSPLVMVAPADRHAALDAALDAAGWEREAPVDILTGDPEEAVERLTGPAHQVVPTELSSPPTPPAALRSPDPVVQLGAAGGAGRATVVLQDDWSLLLALEVEPGARRRGIGAALVRAWARAAEGRMLYLQVEAGNEPARALYDRAGFRASAGYHYRRLPE